MRRWVRVIVVVLALALLAVAGCDGQGGSATGHTESCRSSYREGRCEGSYRTVRGRFSHQIGELEWRRGTAVRVGVAASVEEGTLRVAIVGPEDAVVEAVAAPGSPVALEGLGVVGPFDSVPVVFEVIEGESAGGVHYTLEWEVE